MSNLKKSEEDKLGTAYIYIVNAFPEKVSRSFRGELRQPRHQPPWMEEQDRPWKL
jgi:hypothetical protein